MRVYQELSEHRPVRLVAGEKVLQIPLADRCQFLIGTKPYSAALFLGAS